MIKSIFFVAIGGATGSVARYLCSRWIQGTSQNLFPLGTFAVNIVGCLLIGIFWGLAIKHQAWGEEIRLLLMTGICGGFTTFSALSLESLGLIREQKTGLFILYIAGSLVLGLLATYAGLKIIK
ncbi:MAG: fluoride efflux transporter CrcB [Terrimonas sp.]|nr:fluoride efflux transporter CrcB [Terrimonas sp.]